MTIAPLATATPTPLDPKAAPTETPAIPFADVLAAMRAVPTAEPVAPPATEQPAPSCRPRAGIHPPASPPPVGDAAPWIPAKGRHDEGVGSPPASPDPQARTATEQNIHPGEGRGPVTSGPQLDPGLRRGGAEEEPAHESLAPIAPPPATAAAIHAAAPIVQQRIAVPELPPLSASPEPASAPIRAAVFNERGLLRDVGAAASEAVAWRSIAAASPRESHAAIPAAEPLGSWPTDSLRAPERSAPSHLSTAAPDVSSDTNASRTWPTIAPTPTASPTIATPTTTAPPPPPQTAPQQRALAAPTVRIHTRQPTEPATKRPTKPRTPEPREQQDAADTRLALDAAPQGLTLLAAVARTDRDDRTRLRDRIAGLLSSRGFALADVRVGTAALPSPKDR